MTRPPAASIDPHAAAFKDATPAAARIGGKDNPLAIGRDARLEVA